MKVDRSPDGELNARAPDEVKPVIDAIAELGQVGGLRIRQIECRCPPDYKFCECGDKWFNRKNNRSTEETVEEQFNESDDGCCVRCGDAMQGVMITGPEGLMCERCYCLTTPFVGYTRFRDVLRNREDQVTMRQLLEDFVPPDVKREIVEKFNGLMQMRFLLKRSTLEITAADRAAVAEQRQKIREDPVFHDRLIVVDGEQTHFLRHWISDNGVCIEVSGPETLMLHEHEITELDGTELKLDRSRKVLRKN